MKFEVAIVIAIVWFIIRAISRAAKNNKANLQRGGQITNNSPQAPQEFTFGAAENQAPASEGRSSEGHSLETQSVEGRSLEQIVAESTRNILDPFLEPVSLENNPNAHYNEATLVQEVSRAHETGKPVPHHRHKLFDEKQDRSKAERHAKSTAAQPSGARSGKFAPAVPRTKQARTAKCKHPVVAALRDSKNVKQSFILAEILKRPEW